MVKVVKSLIAFGWLLSLSLFCTMLSSCSGKIRSIRDPVLRVLTIPKIIKVSSPVPSGYYKAGSKIPITILFSEPVIVQGVPRLELNVNPFAWIGYSTGSGTDTLTFNYVVSTGDSTAQELDYVSENSLILIEGVIESLFGVPADPLLPPLASGLSLTEIAFAKMIKIDTQAPVAPVNIEWKEPTPFNSILVTATWFLSDPTGVSSQKIDFYENGDCSLPFSTSVSLNGNLDESSEHQVMNGKTYSFKVTAVDLAGNESSSVCSGSMVVDTTPPTISLSSPSQNTWINQVSDSSEYLVNGTCSETNRTIEIQIDSVSFGSLVCNGTTFGGTIDSTSISQGTHSIKVLISDLAGNFAQSQSVTFIRDTVAPSASSGLTWSETTPSRTNLVSAAWTKSSSSDLSQQFIQFYNSSTCGVGTEFGTLVSMAENIQTKALTANIGESFYSYRITSVDQAQNSTVSACSSAMEVNMYAPTSPTQLSWVQTSPYRSTLITASWIKSSSSDLQNQIVQVFTTATCVPGSEKGAAIDLSSATDQSISFSGVHGTNYSFKITSFDYAGNAGVSGCSTPMLIDTVAPMFKSSMMTLNGGASSTGNNFLRVTLAADDSNSNITKFCLSHSSSTTPLASSTCWIPVNAPAPGLTPSTALSLVDFDYAVGFVPGTYTIYAWVMDEAGNISSLSNTGAGTLGTDKASIVVNATAAPVITDILATNTDSPSNPPLSSELTIANSGTVIIKWKVSDDLPLPATPVSLYYTTDDNKFYLISSGLVNGQNGACTVNHAGTTVDDHSTGCYAWTNGAPTGSYFKIRVAVKDSDNITAVTSSQAINASDVFNFIAGNTDPGLNASAKSAVFFPAEMTTYFGDVSTMVVATDGVIYHRDRERGIIKVSPGDGNIQSLLIPTTGTVNDGNVSSATLRYPIKIALDYQDRLLIWDYDRIRRVNTDLNPITVETIIGGGTSSVDNTPALSFSLPYPGLLNTSSAKMPWFVPMPNGDIYLTKNPIITTVNDGKIVRYDSKNKVMRVMNITGTGMEGYPAQNLSSCTFSTGGLRFDPVTSAVDRFMVYAICGANYGMATLDANATAISPYIPSAPTDTYYNYRVSARNGEVYTFNRWQGRAWKYDSASNSWVAVLGAGGGTGNCSDGTLALNCKVDLADLFVDAQENIYFMDRNVIRIVEKSTNQVKTILGQSLSFGDGGNVLSARFNMVNNIDRIPSGELVMVDINEKKFRSVQRAIVNTIAGTGISGVPNTTDLAIDQPLEIINGWGAAADDFIMNPASGDLYFSRSSSYLAKLNRATGKWVDLMGGGSNYYPAADGLIGNQIRGSSREAPKVIGFDGSNILVAIGGYSSETTPVGAFLNFGYL
jgi:hypothetical protein